MGMTIEEARRELISGDPYTYKFAKALVVAIDIMRKYQKIEQILKDIPYGGEATVRRIQEVVEDDRN